MFVCFELIVGLRAPEDNSSVDPVLENASKPAEPKGQVMVPRYVAAEPAAKRIVKKGKPVKPRKEFQYDSVVLIPEPGTLASLPWAGISESKRTMIVGEVLCESFMPASFHLGSGLRDVTCSR